MKKILLVVIIFIAAILRFYQLGSNPPSLYWDEVALGYNAFSIAETMKDEEGNFLPYQYFRSFGDFKPPVYIYAAVPAIKILGLSEWTTRFPSAFFGTLSVLLAYAVTRQLIKRAGERYQEPIALTTAFLLAISPWHTQISRVAYEANVALFLILFGVYAFFKFLENSKFNLFWISTSAISFVLTLYTFNSNRVFTPLLVAVLAIFYHKEIFIENKKRLINCCIAFLIGFVLLLPLLSHLTSREGQLRYKEVNIFSDIEPIELSNERIDRLGNSWWANIINNRRILFAQNWLDGYFSHFSGNFLFISGDTNPRFSVQDIGQLYIIELPSLLIGLYLFATRRSREHFFILAWMLLAPIPAAFAREVPHALRTLNILPTFQIITAYGFIWSFSKLNTHAFKQQFLNSMILPRLKNATILPIGATLLILTGSVYYYLHNYYEHYPLFTSQEWQYGYKEMVTSVQEIQDEYDRIVVTDGQGRPYINMLFYQKYPPALFQLERQDRLDDTGFGFVEVTGFNKYQFRGINWTQEIADQDAYEKILLVGTPSELNEDKKYTRKVIKRLNGETVFILSDVPKGTDALIELGFLDENGNPIVEEESSE